jgi:hypothetical protein
VVWKLPLAVTVGRLWIPSAAEFTPANAADNAVAPRLRVELPAEVRSVGGPALPYAGAARRGCPA